MVHNPSFVQDYLKIAQDLVKAGAVGEPFFSRGTYQFEVLEGKRAASPFLQITDSGAVKDAFCSCKVSETGNGCPHLAASFLTIFNGHEEPLHVRFAHSLWARLFLIAEEKNLDPKAVLTPKTAETKKRFKELTENTLVENEANSIKFSNLPADELARYREGRPSLALRFELSFWSDIAKWVMHLEEQGLSYKVHFTPLDSLPNKIEIEFPNLHIELKMEEADWETILPALAKEEEEERLKQVRFDEEKKAILIEHKPLREVDAKAIPMGNWSYLPGVGFTQRRVSGLLEQSLISEDQIARALDQHGKVLSSFLPIKEKKESCKYSLQFDDAGNLHIELYVFEPNDIAAVFFPWVYIKDNGFYHLEEWFFEGDEKIVPHAEVADFVNRNRSWLHNFSGFQVHLGSLESHLTSRLTKEGLVFEAELNYPQTLGYIQHFDEWVYIKGQGFYMKKEARSRLPVHPGLKVKKDEISSFINSHKDDLDQITGFFSRVPFIQKMGLSISLNSDGLITIKPQMEMASGVDKHHLMRFGDYFYLPNFGFSEIPLSRRIPERYHHDVTIAASQETVFLSYELEALKPYIIDIDPRLVRQEALTLQVKKLAPARKQKGRQWVSELYYKSESGSADLFSIWDAIQAKKKHVFSNAGLLDLHEPRFYWLRQLKKKQLDREKGTLKLSTMEWVRLLAIESNLEVTDAKTREAIKELTRLDIAQPLDISRLKATLRPYQEQGLQWLWFLYCHGLSGLLCDDMGLGKTHQTMALLAAIANDDEQRENKYLVVCPTSVIYHWQELLKKFLPDLRVCTYYGLDRTMDDFEQNYDLVLTSYGILRTGKNVLKMHEFEVAIFDEIQIAKNHASQTHKALRAIRAQMRLGLSGTPIENRLRELKSLFDIVLPSYLPQDAFFRDEYINPIEKEGDEGKKRELSKLVKPFILRRKKTEVLRDLPEKIEEIAYCDLSAEQKQLYSEVTQQMKETVYRDLKDPGKPVSFIHIFSAFSTLKQICDHPSLLLKDPKNYRSHTSGKWDLFVELLEEAQGSGQKMVVFSQYLDMLQIIEQHLKKHNIGYASIKGSTRDRAEQLRKFRDDPNCQVFVASLLAAGVGIDLTTASIVVHYDRWWNPAKENQATDRVHRIGQNRGVQVFKLVTKETIEEHIHEMIERKKGLLEDIIGESDQINFLSREELLKVFEKMFSN